MGNKIKATINMQRRDVGKKTMSSLFSKLCYALEGERKLALIEPLYVLGTLICCVWTLSSPHKCPLN